MSSVSTHVLDISKGKPAPGIAVRLEQRVPDGWMEIAQSGTDPEGRARAVASGLAPGRYRLVFETQAYFERERVDALYPEIEVSFQIREAAEHYHLPLLISACGYSTYRGA